MKIGAITIGQAPRVDVTGDIMYIFQSKAELLQGGGLDGLTREEIESFKPEEGDYVLVSRLTDGSSVTFAERHILPRLQQRIYDLEAQGVKFIMFFCTGDFPDNFQSKVPLIFPCKILNHIVPLLTKTSNIITVTPSPLQVTQCEKKWNQYVNQVTSIPASPYGDWTSLEAAAYKIKNMDGDLVVLDCIGYTQEMKEMFAKITGKMIVLSRTILARVVSELTDI
ncbi:AroM family protein [Robinsoniella peoriensis]